MTDKNEFDFDDDDFRFDDDDFNLGDDDLPPGLDDDDLPDLEELEDERGGPNRTFIVIADVMILLFLVGLGAVLLLAIRDTGPTDAELTTTAVLSTNAAVEVALNETQTEAAVFANLTATAAAATDTLTPTPTETRPPTVTPTPTLDVTDLAGTQIAQQANAAGTAAALSTLAALAEESAAQASLEDLFATQVAFETRQAVVVQSVYLTQIALATQGVVSDTVRTEVAQPNAATQNALVEQQAYVSMANARLEQAFATRLPQGGAFSTLVAQASPAALETQLALATPLALATLASQATASFFQTRVAMAADSASEPQDTGQVAVLPTQASAIDAGDLATQVALQQRGDLIDQVIREIELESPGAGQPLATTLADSFATQLAFATRQASFNQSIDATRTALDANNADDAARAEFADSVQIIQRALENEGAPARTAAAVIDSAFATQAARGGPFATLVADMTAQSAGAQSSVTTASNTDNIVSLVVGVLFPLQVAQASGIPNELQQEVGVTLVAPFPDPLVPRDELADRASLIQQLLAFLSSAAGTNNPSLFPIATALAENYGTQVAFSTERAAILDTISATQTALADTVGIQGPIRTCEAVNADTTRTRLQAQADVLGTAGADVENLLATQLAANSDLSTQAAQVVQLPSAIAPTPVGQVTEISLITPVATATDLVTDVPVVQATATLEPTLAPTLTLQATPTLLFTPVAVALQITPPAAEVDATLIAVQTQISQLEDLSGLEAFATQSAFLTPAGLSTAAAVATQAALAQRAELIRQALILEVIQGQTEQAQQIDSNAVALTATSLALTLAPRPTQEALITVVATQPIIQPLPTALPDTGLLDDAFANGRDGLGILALMAIGLVGVIAISRRMRAANGR